jgi:hypothetical protein
VVLAEASTDPGRGCLPASCAGKRAALEQLGN